MKTEKPIWTSVILSIVVLGVWLTYSDERAKREAPCDVCEARKIDGGPSWSTPYLCPRCYTLALARLRTTPWGAAKYHLECIRIREAQLARERGK